MYFLNAPQPKAPVLTRACYLLECAHFVHQCNRGQWPTWLKMNLPTYRPSRGGWPAPSQQLPIQRRALAMQLQASKMFHQWAEVRHFLCTVEMQHFLSFDLNFSKNVCVICKKYYIFLIDLNINKIFCVLHVDNTLDYKSFFSIICLSD